MYYRQPVQGEPLYHSRQNVIKVSGKGTVSARPDRVSVIAGTVTEQQILKVAQNENSEAVTKIIHSLIQLGIPQENIQTFEYRTEPQYDYVEGKQIFRGYKVTHLLKITIDQVQQSGAIVDTAVSNGANTISDIQFSTADPIAFYNQALTAAVQDSQKKAAAIANTLNVKLVNTPYKVIEETPLAAPIPFHPSAFVKSAAAVPIEPGKLTITAAVSAQYFYDL